ncbi:MAG: hypothetical protein U0869_18560 [Chloroflexota bacterium]
MRRRTGLGALIGAFVGLVWLGWASAMPPLRITCDPSIPADVCADTSSAGLRRGMPRVHPLITEAHVAPGPAWPDGHGHKATVTYSLFPGPAVAERIFMDAGGHWGVIPDQSDTTLLLWALVLPGVAVVAGAGIGSAMGRRPTS